MRRPAGRPRWSRQRAADELTRYIHPLTGGAGGSGWLFDADLNAAAIAQLLEAVEGVSRVDEVQLFEFDLRTGQRHRRRARRHSAGSTFAVPVRSAPGGGAYRAAQSPGRP